MTAIDFEGVPQKSVVLNVKPPDSGVVNLVALLPKCAAGNHEDCWRRDHAGRIMPGSAQHGWVAFLDNAEEGVHYALGWEGPEVDALRAVAALGGVQKHFAVG